MHPAASVIIFTALSGLGFGLMFFLGLNIPNVTGWNAFAFFFIAYALAVGGLISSTFHLGNPQRALKAFSQWRTSWLSREGVSAVAALVVMGVYATLLIFFDTRVAWLGWLGSALCVLTVLCTAMIYGQLKTVPRWNMPVTPVLFLLYSCAGGALLAAALKVALIALGLLTLIQVFTWIAGDRQFTKAGHTIETATALGYLGKVRLLESPHSGENYLTREMVHVIGRKHAMKLRAIAILFIGIIPIVLLLVTDVDHLIAGVIILAHVIGLFTARWLFFAEAEHVVGLYYDKR